MSTPEGKITIVDEHDVVIGSEERSIARAQGLRHRIARVFLVNSRREILLHRRSDNLEDSPGKWDQSVGGHVDEGEDYIDAARRETKEELGVRPTTFETIGKFYVERTAPGGMVRRFQTVFTAKWDGRVHFSPQEISEVRWLTLQEIDEMYARDPKRFTTNFGQAFDMLKHWLANV